MREVVFDTETTGFDPFNGDRVVEIGCVVVEDYIPTGENYHVYINPERDMPTAALNVHGLTEEFLRDKPTFSEIVADFRDFCGDMKFINWEMENLGFSTYPASRSIDTLLIARRKFPGANNTLDALCKRFSIDNSNRVKHGALLDAELLADVYLELMGGRQTGLGLMSEEKDVSKTNGALEITRSFREPRAHSASEEELKRHKEFIGKIENNLW